MPVITLTSNRRATLPKQTCDELHLRPGDQIDLLRTTLGNKPTWILRNKGSQTKWFGALAKYADEKSHDIEHIRESIGRGLGEEMNNR